MAQLGEREMERGVPVAERGGFGSLRPRSGLAVGGVRLAIQRYPHRAGAYPRRPAAWLEYEGRGRRPTQPQTGLLPIAGNLPEAAVACYSPLPLPRALRSSKLSITEPSMV